MPPPRVAPGTPLSTNLTRNRNPNLNLLHNLTPHPALARRCTEGGGGHPLSGTRETWVARFVVASVIPHSPSAICHLPSAICHLPSAICHLPSAICHLPSAICHLPFLLPYSPFRIPHSAFSRERKGPPTL